MPKKLYLQKKYISFRYMFHYCVESNITYLCISDDRFDRARAFTFLADIQKRFTNTYRNRVDTALPFAMQVMSHPYFYCLLWIM